MAYRFLGIERWNVVLEGASSFTVARVLLSLFLLLLESRVVDSTEVIVVKLYVLQFGAENVHFATVLKDDLVIQMDKCLLSL